jgi:hypothetical protein
MEGGSFLFSNTIVKAEKRDFPLSDSTHNCLTQLFQRSTIVSFSIPLVQETQMRALERLTKEGMRCVPVSFAAVSRQNCCSHAGSETPQMQPPLDGLRNAVKVTRAAPR